ncbi:MAG TPA: glycosyltransferase family 4 protein [Methylomirabilota bacterium]|jgi:UDP-glucose:(heptosyl)LPS alpha-1,3-glucosyltransferase
MKLLIAARPFAFHGGVERATAGLVSALVRHGHDVHLLTLPGQTPIAGVTVRALPLPRLPAVARVLVFARAVRRAARAGGFDIVQSHERTLGQHVYRAGEGCHRAYLAAMGRAPRGLHHRLMLALERRVFATTPHIVAIARAGAAEIQRLYGVPRGRVSVVYNGVDLERFHPRGRAGHAAQVRGEAGLPAGVPVLLFVGSGFARKGLATAVEALAKLGDPSARLVVIGKGDAAPYRSLADRLGVAERVAWLAPRADVERWYAGADVVVLPTRYEPFGNVHLESLACGVPVVTTTAAGGAEVIEEGRNGSVVPPGDASAVAAGVETLLAQPRERVADAARRSAEPFTYDAQVAGFIAVYGAVRAASGD